MNRFTKQTASYWKQLGSVVRNEFRTIFKDGGVMLILIFGGGALVGQVLFRWPKDEDEKNVRRGRVELLMRKGNR